MNFNSNCSFDFLIVAGSERLHRKAFFSKTRKTSKDQEKTFAFNLQNGCTEKIEKAQGKLQELWFSNVNV